MRVKWSFSGVSDPRATANCPLWDTLRRVRRSTAEAAGAAGSRAEGMRTSFESSIPSRIRASFTAREMTMILQARPQKKRRRRGKVTRRVTTSGQRVNHAPTPAKVRAWASWAWTSAGPRSSVSSAGRTLGSRPTCQVAGWTGTPAWLRRWDSSLADVVITTWLTPLVCSSRASNQTCRCPPRHSRPEAT